MRVLIFVMRFLKNVIWVRDNEVEYSNFNFNLPESLKLRSCELFRARSPLYRSQILQVNTRWKGLVEIYKMHSFAPFSNLNFFFKNCWKFCWYFEKTFQIFQVSIRWKALAEMHSFAPFSNLNFFVKNCWNVCCFFTKFCKFCPECCWILLNFDQIFSGFSQDAAFFWKLLHFGN